MTTSEQQEGEQHAVDAAVDELLQDPDAMDNIFHSSEHASVEPKVAGESGRSAHATSAPRLPDRMLSYSTLPHAGFNDNAASAPHPPSEGAGRVSPAPPHPYRYQRAPVYNTLWYEEVMTVRAHAKESGEGGGDKYADETRRESLSVLHLKPGSTEGGADDVSTPSVIVEASSTTTHDHADLVADWNKSLNLQEASRRGSINAEAAHMAHAAWPCDLGKVQGLKVDGRVPEKLLVKRLRARRAATPPAEKGGAMDIDAGELASQGSFGTGATEEQTLIVATGLADGSRKEVRSRLNTQPTGNPSPSWYSNKSRADSGSGSGSGSGFASASGSGDTLPSFSPSTPTFGYPYADPYLDMAHNPYDFESGMYGMDPFHGSAYAYDQSPGGQLAALEAARLGGLTTLGIAPPAAYGGMGHGVAEAYGLGLSSGSEVPSNSQAGGAGDLKGKGKEQATVSPTAPTMAAMATHVQIINKAALADVDRLQGTVAPCAAAPPPETAPQLQQMPFIEYQPSPPGKSGGDQKRGRASVRATPAATAAADAGPSTPSQPIPASPDDVKPTLKPTSGSDTSNARKRKSESLSQNQATTARAIVKPVPESEVEIQKRRREGNAAAAKKCRENQKAKYELVSWLARAGTGHAGSEVSAACPRAGKLGRPAQ